jgi:hypothetical protein
MGAPAKSGGPMFRRAGEGSALPYDQRIAPPAQAGALRFKVIGAGGGAAA